MLVTFPLDVHIDITALAVWQRSSLRHTVQLTSVQQLKFVNVSAPEMIFGLRYALTIVDFTDML